LLLSVWVLEQMPLQQVCPAAHEPQLSVPPQLSEMVPQVLPWAAHVVGVQQVLLLVHTCPAAQQPVPQVKAGAAHVHLPLTQVKFAPQTWPHAPQF
jgi:hypothetical protein